MQAKNKEISLKKIFPRARNSPVLKALFSSASLMFYLNVKTSNALSLIVFFLLIPFFKLEIKSDNKKINRVASYCTAFYMISIFLVKILDITENDDAVLVLLVALVLLRGLYLTVHKILVLFLVKITEKEFNTENRTFTLKRTLIIFFGSVFIMMLCWLPYLLRDFPGPMTLDPIRQLSQIMGSNPYQNHHPIAHTMMIKLFYDLGMAIFNDQALAVTTYGVCQMFLVAMAYSYLLVTMYKFNVRRSVLLIVLGYYALTPYHAVYSYTMWKDIPFAAMVLVFITTMWRLFRRLKSDKPSVPVFESVMLLVFGVGVCLFRTNGFYAYILLVPVLFIVFFRKSKLPVFMGTAALIIAALIKGPLYDSMGVLPADQIESLSIPAQHIAGMITELGEEELTEEEYQLLSKIVEVERIKAAYEPYISDSIKELVRDTDNQEYLTEHKAEYFKLWLELGLRNPIPYIRAQINQTYGYYYPDEQYWVYPRYFMGELEGFDDFSIKQDSKLPLPFRRLLDSIADLYLHVPFLGLLWSIGTATWLCVFMSGVCYIRQGRSYLILYFLIFAQIATLMIATPVRSEFRYIYSMFTTMPLFCVAPFCTFKKANANAAEETQPDASDAPAA